MKKTNMILMSSLLLGFSGQVLANDETGSEESIPKYKPEACLILVETGEQFCQKKGEEPLAQLPDKFYGQAVHVQAEPGAEVILSDIDNLADNKRKVYLAGTVLNEELTNVTSSKGTEMDVSRPASMKVINSDTSVGCIRNIATDQKYCIPKDKKVKVLPDYVYDQPIEILPSFKMKIKVSAEEGLPSESSFAFEPTKLNDALERVITKDGIELNLSHIKSMAVIDSDVPKSCITSRQNGEQFCLTYEAKGSGVPEGELGRPYDLPLWIRNHEIDLKSYDPVGTFLSNDHNVSGYGYAYFTPGEMSNNKLEKQKDMKGRDVDLSAPLSMNTWSCKTGHSSWCE